MPFRCLPGPILFLEKTIWRKLTNIEKRQLLDMIFAGLYFDREGRLIRADAYEPFRQLLNLPDDGLLVES